ncbi:MAG: hypothetical protein JXO44_08850 [Clostridia bacterium]|nr:hypothetical protein [Clostridia bacterium]
MDQQFHELKNDPPPPPKTFERDPAKVKAKYLEKDRKAKEVFDYLKRLAEETGCSFKHAVVKVDGSPNVGKSTVISALANHMWSDIYENQEPYKTSLLIVPRHLSYPPTEMTTETGCEIFGIKVEHFDSTKKGIIVCMAIQDVPGQANIFGDMRARGERELVDELSLRAHIVLLCLAVNGHDIESQVRDSLPRLRMIMPGQKVVINFTKSESILRDTGSSIESKYHHDTLVNYIENFASVEKIKRKINADVHVNATYAADDDGAAIQCAATELSSINCIGGAKQLLNLLTRIAVEN